jgi:hypothetical protein
MTAFAKELAAGATFTEGSRNLNDSQEQAFHIATLGR